MIPDDTHLIGQRRTEHTLPKPPAGRGLHTGWSQPDPTESMQSTHHVIVLHHKDVTVATDLTKIYRSHKKTLIAVGQRTQAATKVDPALDPSVDGTRGIDMEAEGPTGGMRGSQEVVDMPVVTRWDERVGVKEQQVVTASRCRPVVHLSRPTRAGR